MSTQHMQGRLRVCPPSVGRFKFGMQREDSGALRIVGEVSHYQEDALELLRRLIACWNACEGLSTDALENLYTGDESLPSTIAVLRNQRDELLTALHDMNRAYVRLLESGKDRIESLGGQCDPVDVMEANDPSLRESRATIAKVKGGTT